MVGDLKCQLPCAPASFDQNGGFAVVGDFTDGFSCVCIAGDRAEGHLDNDVLAVCTRAAVLASVSAVSGKDVAFVFEVDECPVIAVASEDDVSPASAVSAVGASFDGAFVPVEVC